MKYLLLLEEISKLDTINQFISDRVDIQDILDMYIDFKDEFNPSSTDISIDLVILHQSMNSKPIVDASFALNNNYKISHQQRRGRSDVDRAIRLFRSKKNESLIEIKLRFDITQLYSKDDMNMSYNNYIKMCNKADKINRRISSIYQCQYIKSDFNRDEILYDRFDYDHNLIPNNHYFNINLKIKLDK